jgi:TonB family protein
MKHLRICLRISLGLAIVSLSVMPALVAAEDYDETTRNQGKAIVLEKGHAVYPGSSVRRGQEGWVRASFVVTKEGRAIDPIIIDSSGGPGFERGLIQSLDDWRFEPSASEMPENLVDFRHEIRLGRDAATANFIRRTRRIMTHLMNDEVEPARALANEAYELGGWNLYESTMLWLMLGRVEGAEGNLAGKLEMYQRALTMGNAKALPLDDRMDLLEKIFLLQVHFDQYAAAMATVETLKSAAGSAETIDRLTPRIEEIQEILAKNEVVAAKATISNPCDCEEGQPLWHYVPGRRTFSFANANGNVERFEARCEGQRISGAVTTNKTWTLAPEWGFCRVFVFGDDGATFDFLEHLQHGENGANSSAAHERNHVLDQTSRSQ